MSELPDDLRYSTEHEWVRVDGSVARVGVTDFATSEMGDIVYVSLPTVGSSVAAGDACGELELDQVGLRHLRPGLRCGDVGERCRHRRPRVNRR